MPSVLLIRPLADALPVAKALEAKGMTPLLYPLFEPFFLPLAPLTAPQALIITSKNSLRAIAERKELKHIPLYVVGDQTAAFAQQKGFSKVISASGTSQELIEVIIQDARPKDGVLYHLSGEFTKGNIVASLQRQGLRAERRIVYRLHVVENFSEAFLLDSQNKKISHIMLFSPRTTTLFVNLIIKHKLEDTMGHTIALCLSPDVAEKAGKLAWRKIWISPQPTTEKIMGYFDEER